MRFVVIAAGFRADRRIVALRSRHGMPSRGRPRGLAWIRRGLRPPKVSPAITGADFPLEDHQLIS
jgi:hypothetical protein